jgi:ABC-2 type transport system ATP-binding protein
MINAENLTKAYDGTVVVDHISFSVSEGEIFGFLGPNGAGKTTTIRMLTTLASITQGKCTVGGHDLSRNPNDVRKIVGIVPQDYSTDNALSGKENLDLTAVLYGVPRSTAKKRIDDLLALVKLQDASERQVKTYSGGMRKRLELIAGLIHEPRVLFLDEPTLGLDIQTRELIWNYILNLKKENNMTIFLTTHYLEEADSLCDRVAIIDKGKIVASGSPAQLKANLGEAVLSVELSAGGTITENLQKLSGVSNVVESGNTYRIKVKKPDESIERIIDVIHRAGRAIVDMNLQRPTLDQVFLDVTGRSIREETPSGESKWKLAEVVQSRRR